MILSLAWDFSPAQLHGFTGWVADLPSPYGDTAKPPYAAVQLGGDPLNAGCHYEADEVIGKPGPAGAVSLLALITRPAEMPLAEAFRHWNEHIPLAVEIHFKALSYRQYRITRRLSPDAPDYTGLAVLCFASPEDVLTGLFRNQADAEIIAKDVAEFTTEFVTFFGTEYRSQP